MKKFNYELINVIYLSTRDCLPCHMYVCHLVLHPCVGGGDAKVEFVAKPTPVHTLGFTMYNRFTLYYYIHWVVNSYFISSNRSAPLLLQSEVHFYMCFLQYYGLICIHDLDIYEILFQS